MYYLCMTNSAPTGTIIISAQQKQRGFATRKVLTEQIGTSVYPLKNLSIVSKNKLISS